MTARDYLHVVLGVTGRLLLALDVYLAARLPGDRRPAMFYILATAEWLGRTWRTVADEVRTRRYGPGRGLIAVTINRPKTEKETPRV